MSVSELRRQVQNLILAYEALHGQVGQVGEQDQFHQMCIHDHEFRRSMPELALSLIFPHEIQTKTLDSL